MSMDRSRRDYPVETQGMRRRSLVGAPAWFLRLRLRGVVHEIQRLEALLADEFGIEELRPLIDELERLSLQRDALVTRLSRKY